MFKTCRVALHAGIRHSRGMFSRLRMATACFNGTTHGHVLLIFLCTILVVHLPVVQEQKPQCSAFPHSVGTMLYHGECTGTNLDTTQHSEHHLPNGSLI